MVVLNYTPLSNASVVAEKIRQITRRTDFQSVKEKVTVMITAVKNKNTMHETIAQAEKLLHDIRPFKNDHVELDYS